MSSHYTVSALCSCLHINRSSYYYYQKAKPLRLEKELPDKLLIEEIFKKIKQYNEQMYYCGRDVCQSCRQD